MRDDGEHGQVTVLAAGFVVVLAVLLAGLARVGGRLVQEAVADGAADAAALAGASAGEGAARSVAAANGAVLERIELGPGWARVTVRRGDAVATSAAVLTEDDGQ
ncbi:MAG: helicase/secretion neighborhood TadE-like protein [Acidimicrobiia bacterium]